MEVLYARGEASASDVVENLPDPPSRTAVRMLLRILEEKGHLSHRKQGREFIYRPTRGQQQVGQSALRRLLGTFFDGSLEKAVAAYMSDSQAKIIPEELQGLRNLIDQARKRGR